MVTDGGRASARPSAADNSMIFPVDFFTSLLVIVFFVIGFFRPPLALAALTSGESSAAKSNRTMSSSWLMAHWSRCDHIDPPAAPRRRAPVSILWRRRGAAGGSIWSHRD